MVSRPASGESGCAPAPESAGTSRPATEAAGHSPERPNHRGDPSRPFETARAADYRALLRRRVRCVVPLLPAARHPILPWAFFPSKVHSHSVPARVCLPGWTPATEAADALGTASAVEADEAPLESLRWLPPSAPTEAGLPGRNRGPKPTPTDPPFQRAARSPEPRPTPSVRPKPSWRVKQCHRSLSEGEVVSP
jgi:hypothetical protein